MKTFPGVVPGTFRMSSLLEKGWVWNWGMEIGGEWKRGEWGKGVEWEEGGKTRRRVEKKWERGETKRKETKKKSGSRDGVRKWREGQLEGGKIYLRATGVRIVRGRLVSPRRGLVLFLGRTTPATTRTWSSCQCLLLNFCPLDITCRYKNMGSTTPFYHSFRNFVLYIMKDSATEVHKRQFSKNWFIYLSFIIIQNTCKTF